MNKIIKDIIANLEYCSAGIDFQSADNRKDLAVILLDNISDSKIETKHVRFHHFSNCIIQCEILSHANLIADTYKQIIINLLDNWDILGNWTWTYRVLIDIAIMDESNKFCSFKQPLLSHWARVERNLWLWVSRGRALGQIRDAWSDRYQRTK